MSVILQIQTLTVSQGYSGTIQRTITNSGDENVDDIRVEVVDSEVFDLLKTGAYTTTRYTCLNTFCQDSIVFSDASTTLPASATKTARFDITVKADAPVEQHNLICYWQYIAKY